MSDVNVLVVPVGAVEPNPWNPNRQNDAVKQATAQSIEEFGFIDPVTVRHHPDDPDRYQVIDGEHRLLEAIAQGHDQVPVIVLDVTEAQAQRLTLILNETRGDGDVVLVGKLLADLLAADLAAEEILRGLPYSQQEFDHLIALADHDWDQFAGGTAPASTEPHPEDDTVTFSLTFTAKEWRSFDRLLARGRRGLDVTDPKDVIVGLVKRGAEGL